MSKQNLIDPVVRCGNCQWWKLRSGSTVGLCSNFKPTALAQNKTAITSREFGCINFLQEQQAVQARKMIDPVEEKYAVQKRGHVPPNAPK